MKKWMKGLLLLIVLPVVSLIVHNFLFKSHIGPDDLKEIEDGYTYENGVVKVTLYGELREEDLRALNNFMDDYRKVQKFLDHRPEEAVEVRVFDNRKDYLLGGGMANHQANYVLANQVINILSIQAENMENEEVMVAYYNPWKYEHTVWLHEYTHAVHYDKYDHKIGVQPWVVEGLAEYASYKAAGYPVFLNRLAYFGTPFTYERMIQINLNTFDAYYLGFTIMDYLYEEGGKEAIYGLLDTNDLNEAERVDYLNTYFGGDFFLDWKAYCLEVYHMKEAIEPY